MVHTIHQSCDRGKRLERSTWTHNQFLLGFTLPSKTFMHQIGFTAVISNKYNSNIIIFDWGRQIKPKINSIPGDTVVLV